jgi:rhodanese-related sulfurtransferase
LNSKVRTIVVEAAIVAIVGLGVALAANQLSPRGLALSRNYFPAGTNPAPAVPAPVLVAPVAAGTDENSEAAQLSERLRDKGLQEVKRGHAEILFHDPGAQMGRIVFVDARDEDHYKDGHIPGAYELDPYHPEKKLGAVLTVCEAAEKVVVYCTGGDCEDSDTAALLLRDGGVPGGKLFVYGGGFTEWESSHLPVETGARNSGVLNQSK